MEIKKTTGPQDVDKPLRIVSNLEIGDRVNTISEYLVQLPKQ